MNRFGLSRHIPDSVKREVRQRDGFGCVVCGRAIYEFDHVDPEFANADQHLATGITLLCPSCHSKKTRGFLSTETVMDCMRAPYSKRMGFSFEHLDIGTSHPVIIFGNMLAFNLRSIIEFDGESIFSVLPPPEEGAPFLLNALIRDAGGNVIFEIVENEWRTPSENWDVETKSGRIKILNGPADASFELRVEPPNKIVIEAIDMVHKGTRITCREGAPTKFHFPWGDRISTSGGIFESCKALVRIEGRSAAFGVGCRSCSISELTINPRYI
jgi:hypothetical protein